MVMMKISASFLHDWDGRLWNLV